MAHEKRHRIQLDLSPRTSRQLERLKNSRDASSLAEVVRKAVDCLDWMKDKKDRGIGIVLKYEDGEVRETEFPLL